MRFRLSLKWVYLVSLIGLGVLSFVLLWLVSERTRVATSRVGEERRRAAGERVAEEIDRRLEGAERLVSHVERSLGARLVEPDALDSIERLLLASLIENPDVTEATFTRAAAIDDLGDGGRSFAASPRQQMELSRPRNSVIECRRTTATNGRFVTFERRLERTSDLDHVPWSPSSSEAGDPTEHATFRTPARREYEGRALWSDLAYHQGDAALPPHERRIVVSVQKAVDDADGRFCGVVRATMSIDGVEETVRSAAKRLGLERHTLFLCDERGRLLSRPAEGGSVVEDDGDLRAVSSAQDPAARAALAELSLAFAEGRDPVGVLDVDGRTHACSFAPLHRGFDWQVGVVAPIDVYLGELGAMRTRLLLAVGGILFAILVGGYVVLRSIRADLERLRRESRRIAAFEFSPCRPTAVFSDTAQVLETVEVAKTSMRAMSRYVPVGVVRRLHAERAEPRLGGETRDVTILFTDIADFTVAAESFTPDELAEALGLYLETITRVVHASGGIIDKFIGDAVMALWNAPDAVDYHAAAATRAVLEIERRLRALFAGPSWRGRKPFDTRYGLHSGRVLVGHFGSPERLSYTALGDGVNLAARLESLNKSFGTKILVSDATRQAAGDEFDWRLVDRVVVKGKSVAVGIHELLGPVGAKEGRPELADYAAAHVAYLARDFSTAASLLERWPEDGPSAVLRRRCLEYIREAPGSEWDGVFMARTK